MLSTVTCYTTRKNLSSFRYIFLKEICILIINYLIVVRAEYTDLSSSMHRSSSHRCCSAFFIKWHLSTSMNSYASKLTSYLNGRSFSIPSGIFINASALASAGDGAACGAYPPCDSEEAPLLSANSCSSITTSVV